MLKDCVALCARIPLPLTLAQHFTHILVADGVVMANLEDCIGSRSVLPRIYYSIESETVRRAHAASCD